MRIKIGILCLAMGLASPVWAQVIGGESTYEDNFVHTPPPATMEKPADRNAIGKSDPEAPNRRDLHERDRN